MTRKHLSLLVLAVALVACGKKKEKKIEIQTAAVARRDILVEAEATGVIEPINVVEVKSRASGQITQMPVETGTLVRPGALIVQLDTRDVQNQFDQAKADLEAAEKKLQVSTIQKKRADDLFTAKIITAQENEAAQIDYANSQSAIVRARTNLDLAQQRLDDATVRAPVTGTIIEKPVALGQVIQSGTSAVGGGTTIVKMADLTKVRARAMVNETDIGQVTPGQAATVTVDAFPDRPFRGTVEKIEPQAIVQQNVTMFPVLVSLDNTDGLLMPGMNGEVSIISERRDNVLSIPNDAIRSPREAAQAATLLGLNPDSVRAQMRSGFGGMGGGGGQGGGSGGGRPQQVQVRTSPGYVDLAPQQGGGRQGGGALPAVTAEDCAKVEAARKAKPAVAKKLEDLQTKMRDPNADRMALFGEMRAAYTELGVDMNVVRACRARDGSGGGATAGGAPGAATRGASAAPAGRQGGAAPATASSAGRSAVRSRMGLVFVQKADSTWEPRMVRLGAANYDFTEVISGLEEGEKVALLGAAALQAQRAENQDRMRSMTGGPLGGGGAAAGGGRPGGR